MADITLKKDGFSLEFRAFKSDDSKNTFIVFKENDGSYHTFVEVEAKDAAIKCGSKLDRDESTRKHWDVLWENS